MTFDQDWKAAKLAFETTTNKKKPSDKFLGLVKKVSGIGSAVKLLDGAKTVSDMNKAIEAFDAASDDYVKLLEKAIADPKTVPSADKPAYVAAAKVLKQQLEAMQTEAKQIAEGLSGKGKKDAVVPDQLRADNVATQNNAALAKAALALKTATEHTQLREKVVQDLTRMVTGFTADAKKLGEMAAEAEKWSTEAKEAAEDNDINEVRAAIMALEKSHTTATGLMASMNKQYLTVIDEDGPAMEAREDTSFAGVPDATARALKARSDAAFTRIGALSGQLNTLVANGDTSMVRLTTARSVVQALGPNTRTPKQVADEVTKVAEQIVKAHDSFKIQGDRVVKASADVAGMTKHPKDMQLQWYKLQEDQWTRYGPGCADVAQKARALALQAAAVPKGMEKVAEVAAQMKDAKAKAKGLLDYVQTVEDAGAALTRRIARQRLALA